MCLYCHQVLRQSDWILHTMLCVYIVTKCFVSLMGFAQDALQCKEVSTARYDCIEDALILKLLSY